MSATDDLTPLFRNNAAWARRVREQDSHFFERLAHQQSPQYLWIGCSDSRVPANQIIGLPPGEVFVHRNIANLVVHSDLNCLSVLQFAIDVLRVRHVIVCGHYRCSGVRAALEDERHGLVDKWLQHVHDLRARHETELDKIPIADDRAARLCELNVIEQVRNVARADPVVKAWARGQLLAVHGWIYDVADGLLHDLHVTTTETPASSLQSARAR
ncbi:MAG: carbonate dehydratase [Chthoniobacterales bacterium]|nr:MAG: carbonate dehydratase [Chthoniobacterales bacterium]